MDLVVYSQTYRTRTPERQLELDECLRRNLNHPDISRMVLFCESDAPPLPQGTVPVEVVASDERIAYAEWFRWVKRQDSGIGLLLNADIYLDEGLEHLKASFNTPEAFVALTRTNPGHAGFHLNDYPHWTQDVWGVRADAELPESLLYASSFPLGFPGCDNRIAYVMWSHGFLVRNPCYHVRSVHLQASTARAYDKTSDRLYGRVSYVHPSLAPDEDAELEFTLWTRSGQRPAGVLINQQAIEQGVHQLRHGEAEVAQRFLDLQQFTGLSWVHEAVGSAHLQGDLHPLASEDTVFLPLPALQRERCGATAETNHETCCAEDATARHVETGTGNDEFDSFKPIRTNVYSPDGKHHENNINSIPAPISCFQISPQGDFTIEVFRHNRTPAKKHIDVDNLTKAIFTEPGDLPSRPKKLDALALGMGIDQGGIQRIAKSSLASTEFKDRINMKTQCQYKPCKQTIYSHARRTKVLRAESQECTICGMP
jgi:hypothetical protein